MGATFLWDCLGVSCLNTRGALYHQFKDKEDLASAAACSRSIPAFVKPSDIEDELLQRPSR
jgi:hypothetical protein